MSRVMCLHGEVTTALEKGPWQHDESQFEQIDCTGPFGRIEKYRFDYGLESDETRKTKANPDNKGRLFDCVLFADFGLTIY